jgi:hypothetical protein
MLAVQLACIRVVDLLWVLGSVPAHRPDKNQSSSKRAMEQVH